MVEIRYAGHDNAAHVLDVHHFSHGQVEDVLDLPQQLLGWAARVEDPFQPAICGLLPELRHATGRIEDHFREAVLVADLTDNVAAMQVAIFTVAIGDVVVNDQQVEQGTVDLSPDFLRGHPVFQPEVKALLLDVLLQVVGVEAVDELLVVLDPENGVCKVHLNSRITRPKPAPSPSLIWMVLPRNSFSVSRTWYRPSPEPFVVVTPRSKIFSGG